jgi:hypothetical protein
MFAIIAMQTSAALSMALAFLVCNVILRLDLTKRLFIRLVFYIALSDFGSATAMVIGGTKSQSAACYYQGVTNNYFTLASIFWTMVIGYEVHLVIWHNRVETNLTVFAAINWIFPLILSLIPISTSTYGNDDGTPGWCFLNRRHGYSEWVDVFWFILSFYAWVYIAIFYLLYVAIDCAYKLYYLQRGMTTNAHLVVEKIIYYPLIVVTCWVFSSVFDISVILGYDFNLSNEDPIYVIFTYMLPNLQGFLSGLVFFIFNGHIWEEYVKEVKTNGLWIWVLFRNPKKENDGERVDGGVSSSSLRVSTNPRGGGGDGIIRESEQYQRNTNNFSSSITDLNLYEHAHIKEFKRFSQMSSLLQRNSGRLTGGGGGGTGRNTFGRPILVNNQSLPTVANGNTTVASPPPPKHTNAAPPRESFLRKSLAMFQRPPVANNNNNNNDDMRTSDVEMNSSRPRERPSLTSYQNRPTIDYGGWDDHGDDSFEDHSYGPFNGSDSASGTSGSSTSGTDSGRSSQRGSVTNNKRGNNRRQSLTKAPITGRASLLGVIMEEGGNGKDREEDEEQQQQQQQIVNPMQNWTR